MGQNKYYLVSYLLDDKLYKFWKDIIFITDGYWSIRIEGNTYPIKEYLKQLGFKWSRFHRCWYKYSRDYVKDSKELAEQLSQITNMPIFIVIIPIDVWGDYIIESIYEVEEIVKEHKKRKSSLNKV